MPDPNFPGAETHYMLVPATELPDGLPLDANPREPNVNRPVYRAVSRSLRQEDDSVEGSFHLKHRGLTIVASSVTKATESRPDGLDVFDLHFGDGVYGIVDGGHSYEIVREAASAGAIPEDEYIKLEVMTGLPTDTLVTEIAGGRNTSMQVQAKSLLDLNSEFQFLKDALAAQGWDERVAWHEGQDGEVDVVDVIAMMSCFDIASFPDRSHHPVDAYRRKKSMLDRFQSDPDRYRRLTPVVRDVLKLHDWIALDSEARWQKAGGASGSGGKYGRLEMVETVKPGRADFTFPFLVGEASSRRLRRPAVFPILASFRLLLTQDGDGAPYGDYRPVKWRNGFDEVMDLWEESGGQLLRTFYEHWDSTGRDLHAAGRSPALWGSLYKELAVIDAERRGAI
jgi:hypothetical protein